MGTMNYQVNNGDAYASKYTSQLPKVKEGMNFKQLQEAAKKITSVFNQIGSDLVTIQEQRKSLDNLKKDVENGKSYDDINKDLDKQINDLKEQIKEAEKEKAKYAELTAKDVVNGKPRFAGPEKTVIGLPEKEKGDGSFKIQNQENGIKPVSDNPLLLDA